MRSLLRFAFNWISCQPRTDTTTSTAYAAAKAPREKLKKLVPVGLSAAASCDYLLGAWRGFLDLQYITLATFSAFSREEDSSDPDSEINKALYHATVIYRLAQLLDPSILPFITEQVNRWGLTEEFEEFLEHLVNPWHGKEISEVWTSLEKEMLGRPFSDIGRFRETSFKALGVTWKFRWHNIYELTAAAEQFLASLQIILADLAGIDMCLLRTIVDVEIRQGQVQEILTREIPSNNSTKLEVILPTTPRSEGTNLELTGWVIATATTLLHSASLLPSQQLMDILENAFREGLSTKVYSVERYERLYYEFSSKEEFELYDRRSKTAPETERNFALPLHTQLDWAGGPGPGYSKERADEGLRKRYSNTVPPVARTLDRLTQRQEFKETAYTLREEGWLDWHILLAVMNLALNYRIKRAQDLGLSKKEVIELSNQWANESEQENSIPVPLEEFSVENLRLQLKLSMLATVNSYNLELPHGTPDFEAISDFLGQRYNYWKDDVEHPEYGF